MKTVKTQKCEDGQKTKFFKSSRRKNEETIKTQKIENSQNKNNLKRSKHKKKT